eukprot:UN27407
MTTEDTMKNRIVFTIQTLFILLVLLHSHIFAIPRRCFGERLNTRLIYASGVSITGITTAICLGIFHSEDTANHPMLHGYLAWCISLTLLLVYFLLQVSAPIV